MIYTSKLVPAQTNFEFCFVDVYLKVNINVKLGTCNFMIIAIICSYISRLYITPAMELLNLSKQTTKLFFRTKINTRNRK